MFINKFKILILVYSQATPSLSDIIITQKSIKYFGRVAELTCLLSKSTELPVVWTKVDINRVNEPVVISNGSTLLIDDSRFSFEEISYTNNTLQVLYNSGNNIISLPILL